MISNDFHAVFDEITESNGPIPGHRSQMNIQQ